ncbi:unnamed protein product [Rhodiola kirilowii]
MELAAIGKGQWPSDESLGCFNFADCICGCKTCHLLVQAQIGVHTTVKDMKQRTSIQKSNKFEVQPIPSPDLLRYLVMASCLNSSVLACSYAISNSADLNQKRGLKPTLAAPGQTKFLAIKAQQVKAPEDRCSQGRKAAFAILAATILSTSVVASSASAGIIDDYLEISKANKELNDKKRLATSGANFARAYTVQFGTCKFPYNFTGCQDLAKTKKVPFLSDDIDLECQGKDKYKCGSNVFWKW